MSNYGNDCWWWCVTVFFLLHIILYGKCLVGVTPVQQDDYTNWSKTIFILQIIIIWLVSKHIANLLYTLDGAWG
jgi:hypothetical protein